MRYEGPERRRDSVSHTLFEHERLLAGLDVQVKRLISHVESETGTIYRAHKGINEKLDKLGVILTGNGDPTKGLVVQFDRVRQSVGWMLRGLAAAGLIILGFVLTRAWQQFIGN